MAAALQHDSGTTTPTLDLRGAVAHMPVAHALEDPTGRRARHWARAGRVVSTLFVAWLALLVLGGLGLVPVPGVPLGRVLRSSSAPPPVSSQAAPRRAPTTAAARPLVRPPSVQERRELAPRSARGRSAPSTVVAPSGRHGVAGPPSQREGSPTDAGGTAPPGSSGAPGGPGDSSGSSGASPGSGQSTGSSGTSPGSGQSTGSSGTSPGSGQSTGSSGTSPGSGQSTGSSGTAPGNGNPTGSSGTSPGSGRPTGSADLPSPAAGSSGSFSEATSGTTAPGRGRGKTTDPATTTSS